MLIDSPRLTSADREAWNDLCRYDDAYPTEVLRRLSVKATGVIERFLAGGPAHVSTSWGKDSTVLVDLVGRLRVPVPVVWVRVDGYDLPECELVRDDMLARYPHLEYDELTFPPQAHRWWDDDGRTQTKSAERARWSLIDDRYGSRHITGIRGEESRIRAMVQARWGDATPQTCRPIGDWSAVQVFAYLQQRRLPVHPAYAMSYGGRHDRRWLRVHSLGGVTGADRGRADWESHYYGDVIRGSRERDSVLAAAPQSRARAATVTEIAMAAGVPVAVAGRVIHECRGDFLCTQRAGTIRFWLTCPWPMPHRWARAQAHPLLS